MVLGNFFLMKSLPKLCKQNLKYTILMRISNYVVTKRNISSVSYLYARTLKHFNQRFSRKVDNRPSSNNRQTKETAASAKCIKT